MMTTVSSRTKTVDKTNTHRDSGRSYPRSKAKDKIKCEKNTAKQLEDEPHVQEESLSPRDEQVSSCGNTTCGDERPERGVAP